MNQSFENTTKTAPGTGRVAFIQACWHREIVDQCRLSFVDAIGSLNVSNDRIDFFEVPGSYEIPLQAKLLARGLPRERTCRNSAVRQLQSHRHQPPYRSG